MDPAFSVRRLYYTVVLHCCTGPLVNQHHVDQEGRRLLSNDVAANLDWKVVHGRRYFASLPIIDTLSGNPMADFAHTLVLCCDAENRREAETNPFQVYCAVTLNVFTWVTTAYKYPFVHQGSCN